jgi:hypothetical protein
MRLSQPTADLFIPDAAVSTPALTPAAALARVTHLCIAAHQDDIEIMAHSGISDCLDTPGKWFGGVVVTDGGGSPRTGAPTRASQHHRQKFRRRRARPRRPHRDPHWLHARSPLPAQPGRQTRHSHRRPPPLPRNPPRAPPRKTPAPHPRLRSLARPRLARGHRQSRPRFRPTSPNRR